jgi:hypothetical protein
MPAALALSRFSNGLQRRLRAYCRASGESAADVIHDAVALALDEIGATEGYTLRPDLVPGVVNAFLTAAECTLPALVALDRDLHNAETDAIAGVVG